MYIKYPSLQRTYTIMYIKHKKKFQKQKNFYLSNVQKYLKECKEFFIFDVYNFLKNMKFYIFNVHKFSNIVHNILRCGHFSS